MVDDVIGRIYGYKLDLTLHKPLLKAMFAALDWFIDPLYMKHLKNSSRFI